MALHYVISIAVLSCLICAPANAQEHTATARIGVLMPGSEASSKQYVDGLREGLVRSGLIEGRNLAIGATRAGQLKSSMGWLVNWFVPTSP
jgi:hypothetical protein